ncbi:MAG: indoleamine 2,3-dioxygenase [Candidatus Nanopelagicales bacterium]|nr:indoleamine 2,3-dioxygenase [Candidatus Nanopelagicales bacterium]MDP5107555.1 indoleamine 2,3-dioxygenase [Candidatus Nanopelagicales bacterium]
MSGQPVKLSDFGLSEEFGYMQHVDPVVTLPPGNEAWDEMGKNLPKYLMGTNFRQRVKDLPAFEIETLKTDGEIRRAFLILSYIGQAYQWSDNEPAHVLPAVLAKPWYEVGKLVGRPPILSYTSYSIDNWYLLDKKGPIECGNIALLQCFLGGQDEEWFILIHIEIEKKAGKALKAIEDSQKAVAAQDLDALEKALRNLRDGIKAMYDVLARMPERCDPYVYFHRVRPYIFGWKNNPSLPNGVVYEGVEEYQGKGQTFRGETGAQSAIVPALDAVLGIVHEQDQLRDYLMEMRQYMPPMHVKFIEAAENGPSVRNFVMACNKESIKKLFNESVELVADFRALHLEYAGTYIHAQSQKTPGNPSAVGTGGTPFMVYLRKHRDETRNQPVG